MPNRARRLFRAFTLIEVVTVIAIIAVIATLVTVSIQRARVNARDSRRKTDVRTYEAAIEKYRLTNTDTPNAGVLLSGDTKGAFYGRINFTSQGTPAPQQGGLTYSSAQTIAGFLLSKSLISTIARDPLASNSDTAPDQRDYVLVRCDVSNNQIKTAALESSFAVWASLENTPTAADANNSALYCGGGLSTGPTAPAREFGYGRTNLMTPPGTDTTNNETALKYYAAGNQELTALSTPTNTGGGTVFSFPIIILDKP